MAEEAKKKDRSRWFREMKSEMKKIVWSDRKTVVKDTGTVLLCSLLIGACMWIFDYFLVNGVQLLVSLLK